MFVGSMEWSLVRMMRMRSKLVWERLTKGHRKECLQLQRNEFMWGIFRVFVLA